jgi:hypothetical protein
MGLAQAKTIPEGSYVMLDCSTCSEYMLTTLRHPNKYQNCLAQTHMAWLGSDFTKRGRFELYGCLTG